MRIRAALLASPLVLAVACGGSDAASSALDAALPSYASLSMDQVSSDTTPSAAAAAAAPAADALAPAAADAVSTAGVGCHPHLFVRQREVVARVNRHIYKALRRVERVIATTPLSSTDASKTWERVENGIDWRFTITLVSADVYAWELDAGAVGTDPLPVVMTGRIDRTGAAGPHQGKGSFTIDFAKLHAAAPGERVAQGTLAVQFDVTAAGRTLTVDATDVAWDLDGSLFDAATLGVLSTPRSGRYVYTHQYGKGGSLKLADQMVFLCPANPDLVAADARLVSRWYRAADASVHGRSDALMTGGQLAAPVDRVAAVTCHVASTDATVPAEGFWLMKAEQADGTTVTGASSSSTGDPGATACDPAFGAVPTLTDAASDFTAWPASYDDGIPFPFPGSN